MNNLLNVWFVVIGVSMLSSKVIANNDDPYKDAIPTPDPSTYSVVEQTSEEMAVDSYNKILEEFERAKQWSGSEDPKIEIGIIPRTQLSNLDALELLMDIVKALPQDSYSNFDFNNYDSMMIININREGVDYIYALNTVYLTSTRMEELAQ